MNESKQAMLELADAYEVGLYKCAASGYEEYGPAYQKRQRLVIEALRFAAPRSSAPQADVKAALEPVAWQKRNANNDWANIEDYSDESLYRLDQAGWETRPLYASPPSVTLEAGRTALEQIAEWADLKDQENNEHLSGEENMYGEGMCEGMRRAGRFARAALSRPQPGGADDKS